MAVVRVFFSFLTFQSFTFMYPIHKTMYLFPAVCKAGEFVDGDECKDCEENSYQEIEVPFTSTTCFDCQPVGDVITGTRFAGSNSSSDCLRK